MQDALQEMLTDTLQGKKSSALRRLRLFVALWPDEAVRAQLFALTSAPWLQLLPPQARRTPACNLHLTMAFLGDVSAARLSDIRGALHECVFEPFSFRIDRLGEFPRRHIVWAGSHARQQSLIDLQQALTTALARHDIPYNRQEVFRPHVTLLRHAALRAETDTAIKPPIDWPVDRLVLVRSESGPEIPRYAVL